ncbi:uncharacterized protein LOC144335222 isoform X3 [Macaca mulatta]
MGQQEARTYHTCWIHPGPKLDSPHPSCQHPRSQRSASGTWPSTSTTKPAEETSGPSASLPTSQARKSEKCTFQPSPQQASAAARKAPLAGSPGFSHLTEQLTAPRPPRLGRQLRETHMRRPVLKDAAP